MAKKFDPELQTFAEALRNARELVGMSQAQMAQMLGIAQASGDVGPADPQLHPAWRRYRRRRRREDVPAGG